MVDTLPETSDVVVVGGGVACLSTAMQLASRGASVTLLDAKNNQVRIPRTDIESLNASPLSLMPDGILEKLTPQELCDLFAYLQRK